MLKNILCKRLLPLNKINNYTLMYVGVSISSLKT